MIKGHQTWVFPTKPVILSAAAIGGPFEAKGALAEDFDILHEDIWLGQDSFEKAEKNFWSKPVKRPLRRRERKKKMYSFS